MTATSGVGNVVNLYAIVDDYYNGSWQTQNLSPSPPSPPWPILQIDRFGHGGGATDPYSQVQFTLYKRVGNISFYQITKLDLVALGVQEQVHSPLDNVVWLPVYFPAQPVSSSCTVHINMLNNTVVNWVYPGTAGLFFMTIQPMPPYEYPRDQAFEYAVLAIGFGTATPTTTQLIGAFLDRHVPDTTINVHGQWGYQGPSGTTFALPTFDRRAEKCY